MTYEGRYTSDKRRARRRGFTLVELMVALIVTGIIMSAVATFAYAFSSAYDASDDTDRRQAEVRFATLRISELIRHCKLVCYASTEELAVWAGDDNNDGKINIGEVVYIEAGATRDHLRLCGFDASNSTAIDLGTIGPLSTDWWSAYSSAVDYTPLMLQCGNVRFGFLPALPPQSRFVNISFELTQNGAVRQYHIDSALRCWAGHLLNEDGDGLVENDDD